MTSMSKSREKLGKDQIRLFRFDSQVRPITGSLTVHDLLGAPVYSALSYTWATAYSPELKVGAENLSRVNGADGEEDPKPIIYVDGCPQSINSNLYSALHDLDNHRDHAARNSSKQLGQDSVPVQPIFDAVWVDSICISQDDLEEKSSQVKLMGRIFSQAQEVLVYLGPEHPLLDSFKWCIEQFTPRVDEIPQEPLKLYYGEGILKPQLHYRLGFGEDVQVMKKLTEGIWFLAQCRWFQRTWTLQETVLASHVSMFVGVQSLRVDLIERFVRTFFERAWFAVLVDSVRLRYGIQISQAMTVNAYKRSRIRSESTRVSTDLLCLASRALGDDVSDMQVQDSSTYQAFRLADMLFTTASTLCFDKRDKIFACLGMAGVYCPRLATCVAVDYNGTWRDCFLSVSTTILTSSKSLDLLALVPDALSNIDIELPTWAFNFDSDATSLPFWTGMTEDSRFPNVYGDLHKPASDFSIEGSSLNCTGVYFDTIKVVNPRPESPDDSFLALDLLRFAQLLSPFILGRDRVDVLWRTYILDGVQNRPIADESIRTCFIIWLLEKFAYSLHPVATVAAPAYDKDHQRLLKDEFAKLFGELLVPTTPESSASKKARRYKKKEVDKAMDIVRRYVQGRKLLNRQESQATRPSKMLTHLLYWHYRKVSSTGKLLDQFDLYYNEFSHARARGDHQLFLTNRGFCGAGSFRCKPGDQIWCLGNAHSPYLLRPTENHSTEVRRPQFHLVGECYVLDFMDGRMMKTEYGVANNFQEIEIV